MRGHQRLRTAERAKAVGNFTYIASEGQISYTPCIHIPELGEGGGVAGDKARQGLGMRLLL